MRVPARLMHLPQTGEVPDEADSQAANGMDANRAVFAIRWEDYEL